VFVVGAVSLGVFYYATSYRHDREIILSSTNRIQINVPNAIKKDSAPVSPDPSPLDTVTSLMDQGRLQASENDKASKNAKKSTKARCYEVQAGDTLAKIGLKYGVTVDELQRLNKLVPGAILNIGQKVIISQPDNAKFTSTLSFPRSTSRDTNSPSLVDQSKREPEASSESVLGDKVTFLANQPTKKPAGTPLSSQSLQKKIYEISKANGKFDTAQEIMEGVIIGKRGAVRDRADYYKVKATGNIMTLTLKPSLKDKNQRFIITVFDVNQRLIGGGNSEETSQTITLAVTPQTTYYIKLGLNRAPIETPQYRLSFRFK
jgi:LysM repeat protein